MHNPRQSGIGVRGSFRHTGSLARSGRLLGMMSSESDSGQNVGSRSVRGARMKASKYWQAIHDAAGESTLNVGRQVSGPEQRSRLG